MSKQTRRIETPQFFWMRVAMGLFLDEKGTRESKAIGLYDLYKTRRFCSSTPTLFNSGTLHSLALELLSRRHTGYDRIGIEKHLGYSCRGAGACPRWIRFIASSGNARQAEQQAIGGSVPLGDAGGKDMDSPKEDHLIFAIPGESVAVSGNGLREGSPACVDYRGRREQCYTVKSQYSAVCERLLETDFLKHADWIPAGDLQKGDFVEMIFPPR